MDLLYYNEAQCLEMFKNTLPNNYYWLVFEIENIRQVLETVKIHDKRKKLGRQLPGKCPSPFMSLRR